MILPSQPQIRQPQSVVAKNSISIYALAAAPRQPLDFATSLVPSRTTRVPIFCRRKPGHSFHRADARSVKKLAYSYNQANQRTKNVLADGSYWIYSYDALGQVVGGHKNFYDGTPVPGQQFDYGFDTVGNRTQTKAGGDQTGGNQRLATYTVNILNQITSRDYPGTNDVVGAALATNTVAVNDQMAWRKGEYFWATVKSNNTATAQWEGIKVVSGGNTNNGNLLVPQTPQNFVYDADGNLVSDGLWTNVWNAENRLVCSTSLTNVPDGGRMKEDWSYLPDSRWSQRIVSSWNGSVYVPQYTNKFVWDGKVLTAIVDQTNGLVMSFMRGTDLSGTMQGAGGVGGLLAVTFKTNGTHFAAFDGNGNVAALVNAADGTQSANYEYGAFGEPIRITGTVGKLNPIRFSTQFADDVTGDLWFLYRPLGMSTGTWKSRDLIGEKGGLNLYDFVRNDCQNYRDLFGNDIGNYGGGTGNQNNPPPSSVITSCCCNSKTIAEGLQELTSRWRSAADHLNTHGVKIDPDDINGVSCVNSANHILTYMSPTHKCWKCYVYERQWNYNPYNGDENSIRCDARDKYGTIVQSVVFDWWYETWKKQSTYNPISLGTYDWMFPPNPFLNGNPGAWYSSDNTAPSDDCFSKGAWTSSNTSTLKPLLPPYSSSQN